MKNKKIVFILLLLVVLVSFCITCNAETEDTLMVFNCNNPESDYYGKKIYLPNLNIDFSNRQYVAVLRGNYIIFYYSIYDNTELVLFDNSTDLTEIKAIESLDNTGTIRCMHFEVNISNKDFTDKEAMTGSAIEANYTQDFVVGSYSDILSTNMEIYDHNGKIFFPKTPLPIVAQSVEKVEMSQVLQEIVALLPTILVVVVFLVGLRKGLKMLETFLRQS